MAGSSVSGLRKRPKTSGTSVSGGTSAIQSQSESIRTFDEPCPEPQPKRPHVSINHQLPASSHASGPRSGHAESSHGPSDDWQGHQANHGGDFIRASNMQGKPGGITFASATSLLHGNSNASTNKSQPWLVPPPQQDRPQSIPPTTASADVIKGQTPPLKAQEPLRLQISDWIEHKGVISAFASIGVKSLYPWQAGAIQCAERGENLIYCAPTSGGKSLVAEVLLIRQILRRLMQHGKAVRRAFGKLITPEPVGGSNPLNAEDYMIIISQCCLTGPCAVDPSLCFDR